MNIEVKITADSIEEARAAFAKLAGPTFRVTDAPAIAQGGELVIPAGTDMKVAETTRDSVTLTSDLTQEPMKAPEPAAAPEKPKRKRVSKQAAEMLAESTQEPTGAPEAPQAATTPTEPEKPAETPWETVAEGPAAEAFAANTNPAPTLDEIAAAGAALLDADAAKMMPLLDLLKEYGVQAITQLKPEQLAGFADRLRGLGAKI